MLALSLAEGDVLALGDNDAEGLMDVLALGDSDAEGLIDRLALGDNEAEGLIDALGETEAEGDGERDCNAIVLISINTHLEPSDTATISGSAGHGK